METDEYLQLGDEYPFDAYNKNPPDWAHRAARGIVASMMERRSLKQAFESIVRPDIKYDIVCEVAAIIREAKNQEQ